MKRVIFYNRHANGDSFNGRRFIKHIMDNIPVGTEFYFTATNHENVKISHCKDIGIPDENFNTVELPQVIMDAYPMDKGYFFIGNDLFINIWFGNGINVKCISCISGVVSKWNDMMKEMNLGIPMMTEGNAYLEFDYSFYDVKELETYMTNQLPKYEKLVCVYNNESICQKFETYHDFDLAELAPKYPTYLFITFLDSGIIRDNVISIFQIYTEIHKPIPLGFGVQFSYIARMCDKVLAKMTGPCYFLINGNKKSKTVLFLRKLCATSCLDRSFVLPFSCIDDFENLLYEDYDRDRKLNHYLVR